MPELWWGDIGNGSREGVVLEIQSSELCQILNFWWNNTREVIKREIQNNEFGGKGGWDATREVVMLEEEVLEGRKGGDIRRKISIEEIGTKAENPQGIQLSKTVGGDGARKSNTRKSKGKNTSAI